MQNITATDNNLSYTNNSSVYSNMVYV